MSKPTVSLTFDQGTIVLEGWEPSAALPPGFVRDPRIAERPRAPAIWYRRALATLIRAGHEVDDQARRYVALDLRCDDAREPFPHQAEALTAWKRGGRRGTVVLPTGAGKSYVAELAIGEVQRSTLVVVPTIDLMNQWMVVLGRAFGEALVGAIGGGMHDVQPLTVTTYDSAYIHMARLGDRFGLVIFDECHHLPGPSYAQGAECAIAPFRLGLTATPERQDGGHLRLDTLVGPVVYRRGIKDLSGEYLADYDVVRVPVELNPEERQAYEAERARYRAFIAAEGIRLSSPAGWGEFIMRSSRSHEGRRAWRAWREQRRIVFQSDAKFEVLAGLLRERRDDQTVIFTADNDTVYALSKRHLIPAITHQTPTAERQAILRGFNDGSLRAVVTSKVLNEGVDMPAATVGIVLSGSASVREHVQRLGRILRRGEGKRATLYELITSNTGEEHTSARRREHGAYR